jgi:hypothetical protein
MLAEVLEREACVDHRGHDVAERVNPVVDASIRDLVRIARVGDVFIGRDRFSRKIVIGHAEQVVVARHDAERRRMSLQQIKKSTGRHEAGGDLGPALYVRQPAEGTPGDVDRRWISTTSFQRRQLARVNSSMTLHPSSRLVIVCARRSRSASRESR